MWGFPEFLNEVSGLKQYNFRGLRAPEGWDGDGNSSVGPGSGEVGQLQCNPENPQNRKTGLRNYQKRVEAASTDPVACGV